MSGPIEYFFMANPNFSEVIADNSSSQRAEDDIRGLAVLSGIHFTDYDRLRGELRRYNSLVPGTIEIETGKIPFNLDEVPVIYHFGFNEEKAIGVIRTF